MRVASSRERLLAALVDAAVVILGMAVVVGLGFGAALAYGHVRSTGDADGANQDDDDEDALPLDPRGDGNGPDEPGSRVIQLLKSRGLRRALWGAEAGVAIARRNWRSPGFRVLGLRRVDARIGGPVTTRGVLIGLLFDQAREAATRPLFRSRWHRRLDRMAELAPKSKEIEHKFGADRLARQRALLEFYELNDVKPFAGCGWLVAGPLLSHLGSLIAARNGRTGYDRLTGTIVVSDR